MSYTKGPYKRHFWVVFDNDGNKLADFDVSVENAQLDAQTVIDNANLFVAGPELVEALEQVRGVIEEHCDHANISIIGARDLINYVLTKAKGGQA